MEATELRIGNLIYEEGAVKRVSSIWSNGMVSVSEPNENAMQFMRGIEYFEPIPLTEEWLTKFGARIIKHDAFYYRWSQPNLKGGNYFEIKVFYTNRLWVAINGFDGGLDIPIDFVHEFQNLFFALTGKELQIK